MRIKFKDNKGDIILNAHRVRTVKPYKTIFGNCGNCLYIDGYVFKVGDKCDEFFDELFINGYLDLTKYSFFEDKKAF